jgi:hypothetical protein
MSSMSLGQFNVPRAAQAESKRALREGSFNAGSFLAAFFELVILLIRASLLQSHVRRSRFELEAARLVFRPRALLSAEASVTILSREPERKG